MDRGSWVEEGEGQAGQAAQVSQLSFPVPCQSGLNPTGLPLTVAGTQLLGSSGRLGFIHRLLYNGLGAGSKRSLLLIQKGASLQGVLSCLYPKLPGVPMVSTSPEGWLGLRWIVHLTLLLERWCLVHHAPDTLPSSVPLSRSPTQLSPSAGYSQDTGTLSISFNSSGFPAYNLLLTHLLPCTHLQLLHWGRVVLLLLS